MVGAAMSGQPARYGGRVSASSPPVAVACEVTSDDMKVVYTWPKNANEEFRAYLQTWRGHRLAHVRAFFADADDVDHPGRMGIAVRVDDLGRLQEAVAALQTAAGAERQ